MRIVESFPGEFDLLSQEEIHEKIEKAVAMMSGKPRGGELQLMVDLSRDMSDRYRDRMHQLMDDFAELETAGELELWGDESPDWEHHPDIPEVQQPLAHEELRKAMAEFFVLPEEIDEFVDQFLAEELRKAISEDETFTPPEGVASAARRGLKLRESLPPSRRGGTAVGIARAHQLANRESVSFSTIKRMYSFFARHAVDKQGEGWGEDSKGFQAWLLWGGDAGKSWADGIVARHKKSEKVDKAIPHKYVAGLDEDEAEERKKEIRRRAEDDKPDYKPLPGDDAKTKPSKYTRTKLAKKIREEIDGAGDDEFVRAAAKVSGVPARVIREIMRRGAEAWETGHRPGASQAAWSRARVYSFLTGGKTRKTADADLAREIKKALDDLDFEYPQELHAPQELEDFLDVLDDQED